MSISPKAKAIAIFLILSFIWGTSYILIKQGLKVFSPGVVGALRVASASMVLLPVALIRLKGLTKEDYSKLFIAGLMGIFFPAFLFALAQTRMDSSVVGILNSLTPILTLLIGTFFFRMRFTGYALLGVFIGFAGALMLMIIRAGGVGTVNYAALYVVLAGLCYAINVNFIKFKISSISSLTLTSVSLMLIGPLAIVYLFTMSDFVQTFNAAPGAWNALGYIVLLGVMSTCVATILFNQLIKISTPLLASSVTYVIPVFAVMWGVLDNEKLVFGHFIGMFSIIAGVYLVTKK